MTETQKPNQDDVATPDAMEALVGSDLIEEVSIDGMCGVY